MAHEIKIQVPNNLLEDPGGPHPACLPRTSQKPPPGHTGSTCHRGGETCVFRRSFLSDLTQVPPYDRHWKRICLTAMGIELLPVYKPGLVTAASSWGDVTQMPHGSTGGETLSPVSSVQ